MFRLVPAFGNSCSRTEILGSVIELAQYFIFAGTSHTCPHGILSDVCDSIFCTTGVCHLGSEYAHDTSRLCAQSAASNHEAGMFSSFKNDICLRNPNSIHSSYQHQSLLWTRYLVHSAVASSICLLGLILCKSNQF